MHELHRDVFQPIQDLSLRRCSNTNVLLFELPTGDKACRSQDLRIINGAKSPAEYQYQATRKDEKTRPQTGEFRSIIKDL